MDPFDFDGVDASVGGRSGGGGGGSATSSPARRKSPIKGSSSTGRSTSTYGRRLVSGIGSSPPLSPEGSMDRHRDDTGGDDGNDEACGGSVGSSSVASSSLGVGGRRLGRTSTTTTGGKRSKKSASAVLASRLEELKRREREEEQERLTADYVVMAGAGKKKTKTSTKKRNGDDGGSTAGSISAAASRGSRRRRKNGGGTTTGASTTAPFRSSGSPGSSSMQSPGRRKMPVQQLTTSKRPPLPSGSASTLGTSRAYTHDDKEAKEKDDSSACSTPVKVGRSSGIPKALHVANNELEPSQSSFLSLSASPHKSPLKDDSSSCIDGGGVLDALRKYDNAGAYDEDEEDESNASVVSSGRRRHNHHHLSMESSYSSATAASGRKRTVRRGYGINGSASSASAGGGAGAGGGMADIDDWASVSTTGSDAILGAGVDAFAVQDAGTYRMLSDDCSYLCDTVISAMKGRQRRGRNRDNDDGDDDDDDDSHDDDHENGFIAEPVIQHTSVTAGAACDLALLFSGSRNRAVLLRTTRILHSTGGQNGGIGGGEDQRRDSKDALDSILDAIGCAPFPVRVSGDCGNDDDDDDVVMETDGDGGRRGGIGRTTKSRRQRLVAATAAAAESYMADQGEGNKYDQVAAHALSVLSYYLSLECSKAERSALRDIPAAARRVRRRVLLHGPAVRGVSRMIQFDPVVASILGGSDRLNDAVKPVAVGSSEQPAEAVKSTLLVGVKSNRGSEEEAGSIPISTGAKNTFRDPTKAGRRKRRGKKRRLLLDQGRNKYELETIPEDGLDSAITLDGTGVERKATVTDSCCNGQENGAKGAADARDDDSPQCSPAKSAQSGEGLSSSNRSEAESSMDFISSNDRAFPRGNARVGVQATNETGNVSGLKEAARKDDNIARLSRKLDKLALKLAKKSAHEPVISDSVAPCSDRCCLCRQCGRSDDATKSPGYLALGALRRFLTGKNTDAGDDGDDNENESEGDEVEGESDVDVSFDEHDADDEENDLKNPLMFTNIMLRRSGSLPYLSEAVSDTFVSIISLVGEVQTETVGRTGVTRMTYCEASINYLRLRVSSLFSIIDSASCLSSKNRKLLCSGAVGGRGALIKSLLRMIATVPFELEMTLAAVADIELSALRTLTSLTHENPVAAEQMLMYQRLEWQYEVDNKSSDSVLSSWGNFFESEGSSRASSSLTGVTIILHHLRRMVDVQQEQRRKRGDRNKSGEKTSCDDREKHSYDVVIFCLNILTNVVEMAAFNGARKQVFDLALPCVDGKVSSSLSWLASWLADLTASYRDTVMKSFGDGGERKSLAADCADKPRDLTKEEEENLVTAGNGFILLAYLMKADDEAKGVTDELTCNIRRTILSAMPTDEEGHELGVTLIIKTLKAFGNFCSWSMGPLSVAVITPVLKLIMDLEKMTPERVEASACS